MLRVSCCRVGHHTGIKSNWIESCVVFLARMWAARTLFRADVGSAHIISREGRVRVGFYARNYRCGNAQRGAIFRAFHQCGEDNVRTRKSALQQCGVGHADSAVNRIAKLQFLANHCVYGVANCLLREGMKYFVLCRYSYAILSALRMWLSRHRLDITASSTHTYMYIHMHTKYIVLAPLPSIKVTWSSQV